MCDMFLAFKTIQLHLMIRKLHNVNVPPLLMHWGQLPQSSPSITNTRAPQSCVLNPFLFALYTNDYTRPSPITTYLKY